MNQNPKNPSKLSYVIDRHTPTVPISMDIVLDPEHHPLHPLQVLLYLKAIVTNLNRLRRRAYDYVMVNESTIAEAFSVTRQYISDKIIKLEEWKLVDVIRQGLNQPNIIILLAFKGEVIPDVERRMIKDEMHTAWLKWKFKNKPE